MYMYMQQKGSGDCSPVAKASIETETVAMYSQSACKSSATVTTVITEMVTSNKNWNASYSVIHSEEDLHEEYQGAWKVAISQGVVARSNLQPTPAKMETKNISEWLKKIGNVHPIAIPKRF